MTTPADPPPLVINSAQKKPFHLFQLFNAFNCFSSYASSPPETGKGQNMAPNIPTHLKGAQIKYLKKSFENKKAGGTRNASNRP